VSWPIRSIATSPRARDRSAAGGDSLANLTGHHGGGRWRSEHGSAAGKTEGRSRGGGPENPGWFWSMTVNGPMTRADQSAIGLAVAVMVLITVWGWL
jgi:hypothetical protein